VARWMLGVVLTLLVVLGGCTAPSPDGPGAGAAGPSAEPPATSSEPSMSPAPDDGGEYGPDGY
jgi:hypothetical protein